MSWDDDGNELVVDGPAPFPVNRRDFLKLTSTGVLVLMSVDALAGQETARPQTGRQGYPTDFNAYLHVGADNKVTCFVGKVELGQGAMTSLPQLLAEDLDVALAKVEIVCGDTDLCPWDMGTFGSLSIRSFGPVLRDAAAEARGVLLAMAAERLQAPVESLSVKDGVVTAAGGAAKKVTYGQLTEGKRIERTLASKPAVKPVKAFTIVGTSAPRRDAIEKVTGKAKYAGDIAPAGALHARILRPPAHGAVLASADTSAAEKMPGVTVIRDGDLIAVLHPHWDEADKALALVKATFTRNDPPVDNATIFDHLVKHAPPEQRVAAGGDPADLRGPAVAGVRADVLRQLHGARADGDALGGGGGGERQGHRVGRHADAVPGEEPDHAGVAPPGGEGARHHALRRRRLRRQVRVAPGRRGRAPRDAHRQARARGVHPRGGVLLRHVPAGVGAEDPLGPRRLRQDRHVGVPGLAAGERGAAHFYDIPHHRTLAYGTWSGAGVPGYHPFAVGPWRAPGASTNAFARESHIDVMAAKAGIDPVEFRLKNLTDARMIRTVKAAAAKFGWTPKAAPSGRGVGVACGIDAGTYDTLMVEVAVDKATGAVRVKRVVCAQDQGVVVNPAGSLQQVEGCITMGLGYTFSEEIRFKGGEVLDTNFDTYSLPRFSQVPQIDTVFIDAPDVPAQGCGEPAIVPLGAAVANAIYDAVGARVFQLPMTPARVKAAMTARRG